MIRRLFWAVGAMALLAACHISRRPAAWPTAPLATHTGSAFFDTAQSMQWQQRDSLALQWFRQGAVPAWWWRFRKITVRGVDAYGHKAKIVYWVSPDYWVVGTRQNWVRVPLTPMAAQQMMNGAGAIFPTKKMVDQIYRQARVKLSPMPMYAFRDSSITMYHHHLIIEGQRRGRKGLIAGIKKDVVTTHRLVAGPTPNRVAIYGWHRPNAMPIQPLYTGHVNWYVDYSHGIRWVYAYARVNGKKQLLTQVLGNPAYQKLLCDEDSCGYFPYTALH
jgi:hypothetical protein